MKIKSFPILYKKNTKNIYFWKIFVLEDENVYIMTENGILDGKIKKSKRKIVKEGRENSLFEKAVKDSDKKWKDKIKKEGYSEDVDKLETKDVFISPMLAKKVVIQNNTIKGMPFPVYVQPKLDGFRCLCKCDETIELLSRNNLPYKGLLSLKNNLSILYKNINKNIYLDGELYIHNVPFEVLSGWLKRAQHNIDYDIKNIEFRIFDCFDITNIKWKLNERIKFLQSISDKIKYVNTDIINNINDFKKYYSLYMEEGYEGIMVRHITSPYELSKRSSFLQKYKEFQDDEFEIIGYSEGSGIDEKTVIWKCKTNKNKEFNVRPIGDIEHRKKLFQDASNYIGKMLTVKYQDVSEIGVPRFPVGKDIK